MDQQELTSRWERVFRRRYAGNLYAPGRDDYHGFVVRSENAEGDLIILHATFLTGERYCCIEPGCNFSCWGPDHWAKVRDLMREEGLGHLGRVTVRLRVTVEEGAQTGMKFPGDTRPLRRNMARSYWDGPHVEPTRSEPYD